MAWVSVGGFLWPWVGSNWVRLVSRGGWVRLRSRETWVGCTWKGRNRVASASSHMELGPRNKLAHGRTWVCSSRRWMDFGRLKLAFERI